MTEKLFQSDTYLQQADATVTGTGSHGGVVIDRSVFYPAGGGQPGDSGRLEWQGCSAHVVDARKSGWDDVELMLADGSAAPEVGVSVRQKLDWDRRSRHMRIHTALHLLSVVIPLPVTGGAITSEKGRLDFNMPDAIGDKQALQDRLNELVEQDLPVNEVWITDDELAANPGLVKTMAVKPPVGAGRVRLIRIGSLEEQVDLQPCGGTHVASTGEIGMLVIGKVEKKGRLNRRINVGLAA